MVIKISKKVEEHIKKNNLIGIVLKRESLSFGWAGCRDVIQGELVKDNSQIESKDFKYIIEEVQGVKVFIPEYLKNLKNIKISSNFLSLFIKGVILDVEADWKI